ncbi:hypothetical protein BKA60DRAFT_612610 [Fusarium oxysporum]|nr:hypothetical protein BKA60DRAFT_612610 [Fusarium oxysporum]
MGPATALRRDSVSRSWSLCRHSPTPQPRQTFRQSSIWCQAKNGCMIHASLAAPRQREKPIALIPVDIRSREAGRIDARNSFPKPVPWLRRLGSALHLNEFGGRKDFLRDLIGLGYEVDPNNPDESDDGQLGFIHIAFDPMVNHAKAITPDIIFWYALFEVNRKELDKDTVMLGTR